MKEISCETLYYLFASVKADAEGLGIHITSQRCKNPKKPKLQM
jgi:hypothetical protein